MCSICNDFTEQINIAASFIAAGLRQGEKCVYIGETNSVRETIKILENLGIDTTSQRNKRALLIRCITDSYIKNWAVNAKKMIDAFVSWQEEMLSKGYTGLRIVGEMAWILVNLKPKAFQHLLEYEENINGLLRDNNTVVLCQYQKNTTPARILLEILVHHPLLATNYRVYENIFFFSRKHLYDTETLTITGKHLLLILEIIEFFHEFVQQGRTAREFLQQQLEKLRSNTVQSQEDERKLIAIEIHDVISQRLATLFYRLQTVEKLLVKNRLADGQKEFAGMVQLNQELVDDVSRLMFDLKPPHLEDLGVVTSLRRYITHYQREQKVVVGIKTSGAWRQLHTSIELTIYRIIQEALTNIRKHSRAKHVQIHLRYEAGRVIGSVTDDGVGFDVENPGNREGLGIFSMRERAALLGGDLSISSDSIRGGTVVFFEIPSLGLDKQD